MPGYAARAVFTFDVRPAADLANFPNLILGTYPALRSLANGGFVRNTVTLNGQTVPADLIFTSDAAGITLLSWEIESWNAATGAIVAWVQASRSTSVDTPIYVWVGNPAVNTYQCTASATWSGGSYEGAWHLPNGSALSLLDSSVRGNNGTGQGSPAPSAATGLMDGAASFNGTTAYVTMGSTGFPSGTSPRTLSCWFKFSTVQNAEFLSYGGNAGVYQRFALYQENSALGFEVANAGGLVAWTPNTNWHHIAAVLPSGGSKVSDVLVYVDGSLASLSYNNPTTVLNTQTTTPTIGRISTAPFYYMKGMIDEARVSSADLSAAWIAHEYRQQAQASAWYTAGDFILVGSPRRTLMGVGA